MTCQSLALLWNNTKLIFKVNVWDVKKVLLVPYEVSASAFLSPTKWGQNILSYLSVSTALQQMMKLFSLELVRCCWQSLWAPPGKQRRVDISVTYEHFRDGNICCRHRSCPKKIQRATNSSSEPRELILNIWFSWMRRVWAATDSLGVKLSFQQCIFR